MNRTAVLHGTGHFAVPAVLVVGVSMATLAVVGTGPYRTEAASPRPASTVTVTATPAPVAAPAPGRTTVAAKPRPTATSSAPAPSVVSAADRTAAMPHTSSGGTSHAAARPPSAPSPSPVAPSCAGGVLSVQALHALCVSLGR